MKHADFKKLTGWIDYDRAQLPKLTYHQKVLYFDKRLRMVLIKPLIDVFNGVSKAPKQSSLLIFATSVCKKNRGAREILTFGSGGRIRKLWREKHA